MSSNTVFIVGCSAGVYMTSILFKVSLIDLQQELKSRKTQKRVDEIDTLVTIVGALSLGVMIGTCFTSDNKK